jgi:hypothetical protein
VLSVPLIGAGAAELILFHAISAAVRQATEARVIIVCPTLNELIGRFRDLVDIFVSPFSINLLRSRSVAPDKMDAKACGQR